MYHSHLSPISSGQKRKRPGEPGHPPASDPSPGKARSDANRSLLCAATSEAQVRPRPAVERTCRPSFARCAF